MAKLPAGMVVPFSHVCDVHDRSSPKFRASGSTLATDEAHRQLLHALPAFTLPALSGIAVPVKKRILLGVGAAGIDKALILLSQLIVVPVLASHWGLLIYSSWILLSTIPSFLSMGDFGFGTAAGNRMTMMVARGDRSHAICTFHSAWAVVLGATALVIVMALAVTSFVPAGMLPTAPGFAESHSRQTLAILVVYTFVSLQGSIFLAGFRCSGGFAIGLLWHGSAVFFESLLMIAAVVIGGSPVVAAAALLVGRAITLVGQAIVLRRTAPWLRFGVGQASRAEIRELTAPALAVVVLPLAQASFLQGTTIALGIVSQAAVPAFTVTRTLSRIGLQLSSMTSFATAPDFSAAAAREDYSTQAVILLATLTCSALVAIPYAAGFIVAGQLVIPIWTHGTVHASQSMISVMAVAVIIGSVWMPVSTLILAVNRHAGYSYPFVVLALLSAPVAYLLAKWLGATGVALAMALLDLSMCFVVLRLARGLFGSLPSISVTAPLLLNQLRRIAIRLQRRPR